MPIWCVAVNERHNYSITDVDWMKTSIVRRFLRTLNARSWKSHSDAVRQFRLWDLITWNRPKEVTKNRNYSNLFLPLDLCRGPFQNATKETFKRPWCGQYRRNSWKLDHFLTMFQRRIQTELRHHTAVQDETQEQNPETQETFLFLTFKDQSLIFKFN